MAGLGLDSAKSSPLTLCVKYGSQLEAVEHPGNSGFGGGGRHHQLQVVAAQVFDEGAHAGQQVEAGVFVERFIEQLALAHHHGFHVLRKAISLLEQLENVARRLAQKRGVLGGRNGNAQLGKLRKERIVVQGLGVDYDAVHVENNRTNHAGGSKE